ncbi:DUF6665 family protein [Rhizobium sp. C4]|uniref:DUF6665 family protein n=1 Tax=Rhizobium sp. C4 TaxID=1349800 RepID=UPI001E421358|nr:DUF6665 family protein [Rhizobium sp. C4]MCD2175924.1 hypothetical protein [Rhizobium sp. C4]
MSLRMPREIARLSRSGQFDGALSNFEAEALSESASSLGHQGRKVEKALAALAVAEGDDRQAALAVAAEAVWAYFVQRELCGLRDHRLIIREMGIPGEVLTRLGAAPKSAP